MLLSFLPYFQHKFAYLQGQNIWWSAYACMWIYTSDKTETILKSRQSATVLRVSLPHPGTEDWRYDWSLPFGKVRQTSINRNCRCKAQAFWTVDWFSNVCYITLKNRIFGKYVYIEVAKGTKYVMSCVTWKIFGQGQICLWKNYH
jgi:hypothetical protein